MNRTYGRISRNIKVMACLCIYFTGHGACTNILGFILSVSFAFHLFGAISPAWYCNGDGCDPEGLYYTCEHGCRSNVSDVGVLVLVLMVLCSSLLLVLAFCVVVNCSSRSARQDIGPGVVLGIGAWFTLQELMTTMVLAIIRVKNSEVGWSAYCFTVPGIIFLFMVVLMLICHLCWPEKTVNPD